MSNPFVSIIIPTYRDWHRLSLCLKALDEQTYHQDYFEIIVVNNDPGDPTPGGFYTNKNCTIISESKPGSYAARNAGIDIAKGEIIGFTDSDCIPDKNWILNAVSHFTNYGVSRIGGSVTLFFKTSMPTVSEVYDTIFSFPQKMYVEQWGWAVTANMFTLRSVVDHVGRFNQNAMSGGDQEWGKLADLHGYKIVYDSNVRMKHPARDSLKELFKKSKRTSTGKAELDYNEGKRAVAPLSKKIYIVLRPKFNELPKIKKRVSEIGLSVFYIPLVLMLRNIILSYADYIYYRRQSQLLKAKKAN
jgi:glycosyltransferase involved in cell wall biosynthesis